ncbi:MAG TPA: bifunctional [glutamine synthetase] adenylyltransferase/[glutamine synthetase]-adenylyl-L-tyrosine phosphorylase [Candidatus Nanopelagicales bacterium]|nr:bifunctional [glutamine synthetase] adenylyltransferase/[glutamine synthetase]-adenylyl-L-tyrosine phosphorylase [Candidatus Nanopelagicales bacterium]
MTADGDARASTLQGRLARLGFDDAARGVRLLSEPGLVGLGADAVDDLAKAPDPDGVLTTLSRLAESGDPQAAAFVAALDSDDDLRARAYAVLGTSAALGDHLVRHPEDWVVLTAEPGDDGVPRPRELQGYDAMRADLLIAVGADPAHEEPVARDASVETLSAMRAAYRRRLLAVAAADIGDGAPFVDVSRALADLADAALAAALAIARAAHPDDVGRCRLAVVAMGKCGGHELNYLSDVDVLFVAEPAEGIDETEALAGATRLAQSLMHACVTSTPEGSIWEVDPNLRPEGRNGALVRTLASYEGYYRRWASTWEFQALLKARLATGDDDLGRRFVELVTPLVWTAADRPHFVEDVQAMRRRVEENVPAKDADRQLKLGPGGLRDVEFSVQLLQLVHGRSDVMLHSPTTLPALESLATWGYVGREDASGLAASYTFLRTLEHRIQVHRMRRTHVVPDSADDLRRLGRSMGFRTEPAAELTDALKRHRREVRRLHEKLFYRPLLNAVARLDAGEARLTPEAARQRLEALGYADPAGALRHLEALTSGVTRRAAIQRTLLPVMLGWFATAPDPDAGLLNFRRMSDALGSTHWYLRLLRDESSAARRLATMLASSRYASGLLLRSPDAVQLLADDSELEPRGRDALVVEALSAARRHDVPEVAVAAVRALRRRELFRTAAAELFGVAEVDDAGVALSDIAAAAITGALEIATRSVEAKRGAPLPTRMLVVAMGRFGGGELGFASDADVMFVHDPLPGADEREAHQAALAVAEELRRLLMVPSPDPALEVDADLRPEGRNGPLVRTLASYAAYYARWSSAWEAQALLRAEPVAGDEDLGRRFVAIIDPLRYPEGGLLESDAREIRRLKARMEAERLPRGADPGLHTKLGRGGLSDVEWVAQLLTLRHGSDVPGLRTTRTLPALHAAADAGLLAQDDATELATAWRTATRVRDAVMLVRGTSSDMVPTDARELAAVGYVLGYRAGETGALLDDYRRVTRRARAVVERVFYGDGGLDRPS